MKKIILSFVMLSILGMSSAFAQGNRLWATYFGGPDMEYGCAISTDNSGNVFLAGNTYSSSGVAYNGFQNTYGGGAEDAYLVKFDISGNRLWATYYGGSNNDEGDNTTTDNSGNVYLVGLTSSTSGIASSGAYMTSPGGAQDAFLAKFSTAGNRLWGTYFGGPDNEYGYDVKTDAQGYIYITGRTNSASGIATTGSYQTYLAGDYDAFLAKFDPSGTLIWSTYFGGSSFDMGNALSIDPSGNVYVVGLTSSTSGIASGGYQNTFGGGSKDAFLAKFNYSGNLLWSTYYGGSGNETGAFVSTDLLGNAYICGTTSSTSGIASAGGFQTAYGGGSSDGFLAKFSPSGTRLWATYYGGSGLDIAKAVSTDPTGNVYFGGDTYSTSGIASGGFQNSLIGTEDVYLAEFDSTGNRLCASYFGQGNEALGKVETSGSNTIFICGNSSSTSGIAYNGFQSVLNGPQDALLVKFSSCYSVLSATTIINRKTCSEHCNGSATANAQGGTTPYSYVWSTSPPQTTATADSLCAGNYTVTITDGSGNTVTSSVVITNYPTPTVTITEDTATSSLICHPSFLSYQWYLNGTLIPGATSQTYTPTQNGNYTVVVTDSNGCTIVCVNNGVGCGFYWAGITEFLTENNIFIYPNPANDNITIESTFINKDAIISIYNIEGQLLIQQAMLKAKTNIDISGFADGMYYVKVSTEKGLAVKKFVKE